MAALDPDNTMRLWVDYNDGVYDHSFQLRGRVDSTPGDLMVVADAFLEAVGTAFYELTIIGARFALAGTNIANPVAWTGAASYGTGVMPEVNAPREIAWEGRSADGRLTSVSLYGFLGATPANYRFAADESAPLTAGRAALVAASEAGTIGTISSAKPIWKTYQNFNFNSYYERQNRG